MHNDANKSDGVFSTYKKSLSGELDRLFIWFECAIDYFLTHLLRDKPVSARILNNQPNEPPLSFGL